MVTNDEEKIVTLFDVRFKDAVLSAFKKYKNDNPIDKSLNPSHRICGLDFECFGCYSREYLDCDTKPVGLSEFTMHALLPFTIAFVYNDPGDGNNRKTSKEINELILEEIENFELNRYEWLANKPEHILNNLGIPNSRLKAFHDIIPALDIAINESDAETEKSDHVVGRINELFKKFYRTIENYVHSQEQLEEKGIYVRNIEVMALFSVCFCERPGGSGVFPAAYIINKKLKLNYSLLRETILNRFDDPVVKTCATALQLTITLINEYILTYNLTLPHNTRFNSTFALEWEKNYPELSNILYLIENGDKSDSNRELIESFFKNHSEFPLSVIPTS